MQIYDTRLEKNLKNDSNFSLLRLKNKKSSSFSQPRPNKIATDRQISIYSSGYLDSDKIKGWKNEKNNTFYRFNTHASRLWFWPKAGPASGFVIDIRFRQRFEQQQSIV